MTETHYFVLEVSGTASAGEIKAAYLKLIRQVHPDLIANAPEYWRKQAEEKTKVINEAYDVLSNPEKRRLYDQQLDEYRQAQECQARGASQSQNSTTVNTQSHNQTSTGWATPPPSETVSPQAQRSDAQAPSWSPTTLLIICVIIVLVICAIANLPKRTETPESASAAPTPLATDIANQVTAPPTPTLFGNASCSGRPDLGDYRLVNGESRTVRNNNLYNLKATLSSQPQDEDGYRIFGTQDQSAEEIAERIRRDELKERNISEVRTCELFNGNPGEDTSLHKSSIQDGERLEVLGRSAEFNLVDHGAAWYKVRTEHAGEGFIEYRAIKCDGAPESCKCGGDLSSCPQSTIAAPPPSMASKEVSGALAQTFSHLSIGGQSSQAAALGTPAATGTYKSYAVQKWNLTNGNDLSIAIDGAGGIVYMELDWGGNAAGRESDFQGLVFGVTTLSDLRKQLGSNGFAFKERGPVTAVPDGVLNINSYEDGENVVTFFTKMKITYDDSSFSADRTKLVAISMADPEYAKIEWGDRMYDPNYRKVEWKH